MPRDVKHTLSHTDDGPARRASRVNRALGGSGLSQSPKDLQNDLGWLSRETPRLWRRAGRSARPRHHLAQLRVLTA